MANILALLVLFVGVPLNLLVTFLLFRAYRASPTIRVLRERFITSLIVLVGIVLFGLIFINNDTLPPPFDVAFTKLVTRSMILVLAVVPAVIWLALYWDSE